MKNNDFWKFILVAFIICWSFFEIYPPTSRDLVQDFETRAVNRDAAFSNIVVRVEPLRLAHPDRAFANLQEAIGTNDIQNYFPFFNAKAQVNPTTFILNRLQRDASGKIKLGLDLQGGTAFVVEMDTNALAAMNAGETNKYIASEETAGAISQAVEVLRKRVDQFGVAEPVIQPQGADQILVQLPGLSEAVKQSAKEQIQKAAYLEFRMVKEDSQQIIDNKLPVPPGYELLRHVEPKPTNLPPKIE